MKLKKKIDSNILVGYLMLAPFVVLFFAFTVLPVLSSLILSLTNYDMISTPGFVGLNNYLRMVSDDILKIVIKNTLFFACITGPVGFFLSFVLAWMINELPPRPRSVLSFLFYAPSIAGNVYLVWQVLFSGDSYGYINSLLLQIGWITEPVQWLKNSSYAMGVVIIVQLWLSMGVSFLANIAGLQNASPELYEAGAIDGIKNRWQELWYITLPSMKNILLFSGVMQIQSSFSAGGVMSTLVGYPSVDYCTDTIVLYLADVGTTRFEMGYAAAISVLLFAFMAISRILIGKLLSMTGK